MCFLKDWYISSRPPPEPPDTQGSVAMAPGSFLLSTVCVFSNFSFVFEEILNQFYQSCLRTSSSFIDLLYYFCFNCIDFFPTSVISFLLLASGFAFFHSVGAGLGALTGNSVFSHVGTPCCAFPSRPCFNYVSQNLRCCIFVLIHQCIVFYHS